MEQIMAWAIHIAKGTSEKEGKGKIRFEVENKDGILRFKSQPFSSTYSNDVATLGLWKELSSENGFNPSPLCVCVFVCFLLAG